MGYGTSMNLTGNFDVFDDFQTVEIFRVKNFESISTAFKFTGINF